MISKTKLKARANRKKNPEIAEIVVAASKEKGWNAIGKLLSGSKRNYVPKNLSEIDAECKAGDSVVVVGRVLSGGELTKKVRICALGISERAREKLKESKSEIVSILEEIKKNPKAEGIKLLR